MVRLYFYEQPLSTPDGSIVRYYPAPQERDAAQINKASTVLDMDDGKFVAGQQIFTVNVGASGESAPLANWLKYTYMRADWYTDADDPTGSINYTQYYHITVTRVMWGNGYKAGTVQYNASPDYWQNELLSGHGRLVRGRCTQATTAGAFVRRSLNIPSAKITTGDSGTTFAYFPPIGEWQVSDFDRFTVVALISTPTGEGFAFVVSLSDVATLIGGSWASPTARALGSLSYLHFVDDIYIFPWDGEGGADTDYYANRGDLDVSLSALYLLPSPYKRFADKVAISKRTCVLKMRRENGTYYELNKKGFVCPVGYDITVTDVLTIAGIVPLAKLSETVVYVGTSDQKQLLPMFLTLDSVGYALKIRYKVSSTGVSVLLFCGESALDVTRSFLLPFLPSPTAVQNSQSQSADALNLLAQAIAAIGGLVLGVSSGNPAAIVAGTAATVRTAGDIVAEVNPQSPQGRVSVGQALGEWNALNGGIFVTWYEGINEDYARFGAYCNIDVDTIPPHPEIVADKIGFKLDDCVFVGCTPQATSFYNAALARGVQFARTDAAYNELIGGTNGAT